MQTQKLENQEQKFIKQKRNKQWRLDQAIIKINKSDNCHMTWIDNKKEKAQTSSIKNEMWNIIRHFQTTNPLYLQVRERTPLQRSKTPCQPQS